MNVPGQSPLQQIRDIEGQLIELKGQPLLLFSLFREATCPFCNYRVYELTRECQFWSGSGIEIVAVFHSSESDVRRFIAQRPRPFRVVADPTGYAHSLFETDVSLSGKVLAMAKRMPAWVRGIWMAGLAGFLKGSGRLLPADFMIDEHGQIIEAYYGRDAGDHIPLARVESHLLGKVRLESRR
ncbi:peroxiredoxin family protein [Acidihalobacter yilgarnensis]|uniref:peroxiredoxin family protein n=1 Tax=Acidihalobacter yilgarnensis TaxID=2819280 RepID=UPI0009F547B2|nr:redoxin domain-containing protein [Acidihalobacter yilgarnensis]